VSLSFFLPESKFHCVRNSQLFGASAWTKEYVLNVQDYSKATWTQNFIASISGAVASITVAAPLDTIKTRIQNANFEHKVSGVTVVKDMLKHEGPMALFKGLTPKVRSLPLYIFFHTTKPSDFWEIDPRRWSQARVQLYNCPIIDTLLLEIRLN